MRRIDACWDRPIRALMQRSSVCSVTPDTRDHEASLRHQTQRLQRVPGRVPRDLRAGVVRLRVGGADGVEQKHSGRTADHPHRLQHWTHDGRLRVRRRVGRSPQSGRVSGDGDSGEAEDLEVSRLCDGADARGVRRRGRGVRTVLRRLHGFHQRDPVGDGHQRHGTHLCIVSGETPDRSGRIRGSGGGNGNAGALYSGHHRREEHRRSEGRGAAGRGSDPPGHQRVDGAELRLPSEPGARPRPATLHRRRRMGDGGVQHCRLLVVDPRCRADGGGRRRCFDLLPVDRAASLQPQRQTSRRARGRGGRGGRGGQQPEGQIRDDQHELESREQSPCGQVKLVIFTL